MWGKDKADADDDVCSFILFLRRIPLLNFFSAHLLLASLVVCYLASYLVDFSISVSHGISRTLLRPMNVCTTQVTALLLQCIHSTWARASADAHVPGQVLVLARSRGRGPTRYLILVVPW